MSPGAGTGENGVRPPLLHEDRVAVVPDDRTILPGGDTGRDLDAPGGDERGQLRLRHVVARERLGRRGADHTRRDRLRWSCRRTRRTPGCSPAASSLPRWTDPTTCRAGPRCRSRCRACREHHRAPEAARRAHRRRRGGHPVGARRGLPHRALPRAAEHVERAVEHLRTAESERLLEGRLEHAIPGEAPVASSYVPRKITAGWRQARKYVRMSSSLHSSFGHCQRSGGRSITPACRHSALDSVPM